MQWVLDVRDASVESYEKVISSEGEIDSTVCLYVDRFPLFGEFNYNFHVIRSFGELGFA